MKQRTFGYLMATSPLLFCLPAAAQVQTVSAGSNLLIDFNQEVEVSFDAASEQYNLDVNLNHDPAAGPMFKLFDSPTNISGAPILLDALQPLPLLVNENFYIVPSLTATAKLPITDWHEQVVTPGWQFVIPSDAAQFPGLFPADAALVTKNGVAHPWEFIGPPQVDDITRLDLEFPPIDEDHTLDIHKALLWVGTPENRIWGDNQLDDGNPLDESTIRVWEYPTTVPEPSTLVLIGIAGAAVAWCRRKFTTWPRRRLECHATTVGSRRGRYLLASRFRRVFASSAPQRGQFGRERGAFGHAIGRVGGQLSHEPAVGFG